MEELKKQIEEQIKRINIEDMNLEDLEKIYKLVDIHKDLCNEEYWEIKKEVLQNDVRKLWKKNERFKRKIYGR